MEFNTEKTLWSFAAKKNKETNLQKRILFRNNAEHDSQNTPPSSARTPCASPTSFPLWHMNPVTLRERSPRHTSPHPSLLYSCLTSLRRHEGNIFSIAISKDYIFTSSQSSRIYAWKQPNCNEMGHIESKYGGIQAILAYGRLLFTTHSDYKIRVWNFSQTDNFRPKKATTLPKTRSFFLYHRKKNVHQHKDSISCIAYNVAEKLLYTGSWDKTVKVWKVSDKACVDSFVAHEGQVNAIVINQQDGCVFTCSSDSTVKIWRRVFLESSHILTMTLKWQPSPVNSLALSLSSSGCFLYSGSSDGLISFWKKEKTSGRFNYSGFLQGHHFGVLCVVSIGDLVLSGSEDSTIRVWRREKGDTFHTCLAVMDGHHGPVRCLAASVETEDFVIGLLVYSASLDQTFKVWRLKVYPADTGYFENSAAANDQQHCQSEIVECVVNPVLSPSWVEMKVQSGHFYK